jgi:5'-phosphate synthase pdxT subunit
MRVGVVALQGGFAAHAAALARCGVEPVEVRRCSTLQEIDALVLPGGESTTLLNLMNDEPWFESLRSLHAAGKPLFGTCAGAILLSRRVVNPIQPSLGLIDADIERNAWGRQVESFETRLTVSGIPGPVPAVFIRAPRFRRIGAEVEVLAEHRGEPVLVRQGAVLAATFHPELTGDDRLHRLFLAATSTECVVPGSETAQAAT